MSGHTPGPWNVRSEPDENIVFVESEVPFQLVIATCGKANSPIARTNARLISLAPAMLEALKAAQTALEWTGDDKNSAGCMADRQRAYTAIRAAIAAAEPEAGND